MLTRLKNIVVGFLSLFIRGLEVSNPEALLEGERERLREAIAQYNQNLARQAGFIERIKSQSAVLTKQSKELTASTQANLKAGKTQDARAVFKRVVDEFPTSTYAAAAQQALGTN